MDVQRLRAFRSVVATGSVRAAADVLGYSPSAISQQIGLLQRDTEVRLFTHVGRGLEPTEAGHALARRIDGVLGELADLDAFVRDLRHGHTGVVTLAYFPSLGATWLPRIIGPLVEEFPQTRIDLQTADSYDPGRRPRPDVQLVVPPKGFVPPAGYTVELLAEDPYVVALPADHPGGHEDEIALVDVAAESWIDNDAAKGWCWQVAADACAAAGFQPQARIQTSDYPSALALVATGVGVSLIPALATRQMPDGVITRPVVRPTPVRRIHAFVLGETAQTDPVRRAMELVRDAARPR